jgi:hypothetical protein
MCYNDIIMVHQKVQKLWYNSFSHTTGPQIDCILQKSLAVFPHLESTTTTDVITFYDCLQEFSINHLLALMPFDAIILNNHFKGLCPPGLGLAKYSAMSKGFMELLPWLIPGSTSSQINVNLALVWYESGNRYDYLSRIMELIIPGFDLAVSIQVPMWTGSDDIFSFAQEYLLYFHLQEKLNFHFDDQNCSGIFLWAIKFSEFADTVTLLQTQMNSYQFEYDNGYLPPHLCIHGLPTSIHQNTQAHLKDIATPCTHRIDANIALVQGLPVAQRISGDNQGLPLAHRISPDDCLHGGYHVKPSKSGNGRFRDSGGDSNNAEIKAADGATMAALMIHAFPVTVDDPRAPDASFDRTATNACSSNVYNIQHTSALAMLPNNTTCLLQLFVWNVVEKMTCRPHFAMQLIRNGLTIGRNNLATLTTLLAR